MAQDSLRVYADDKIGAYGYANQPWFQPHRRQAALLHRLRQLGLDKCIDWHSAPLADDADLYRLHPPEHVEAVRAKCAAKDGSLDHGPTLACPLIEAAATHVVGAVSHAARAILDGDIRQAFVPIAGFHHAFATQARQFSIYNDCVIALSIALERLQGNVIYIDIDIHHGDGVYRHFASEPRLYIVDIHENRRTLPPFSPEKPYDARFPGDPSDDGLGPARRTKLNVNLEPFTTDERYAQIIESVIPFVSQAKPEMIVLQAGVDGMCGDPTSHQARTPDGIFQTVQRVKDMAVSHAGGRLLVLGGGGYVEKNIALGWTATIEALLQA